MLVLILLGIDDMFASYVFLFLHIFHLFVFCPVEKDKSDLFLEWKYGGEKWIEMGQVTSNLSSDSQAWF